MNFLLYISNYIIPFIIFYVVGLALLMKVNAYEEFIKGAKDGLKVVVGITPTLIGLMMAVGILRASGALEIISDAINPLSNLIHFPSELVPLVLIKMFSSSAATSLLIDVFKEYGADSYFGILGSILMSCSETIFYTMSIYFMTAGVKKTRYTLFGALVATLAGILSSVFLTNMLF